MRKLLFLSLICVALLSTGCGLLPGKTYDGSESFNEAHPEYSTTPTYMQPGDSHSDGN